MLEYPALNQLSNLDNKFQSKAKRVLCVCSAGMLRSPTVANVLHKEFGYNTRAVGLMDYALIPVSMALLMWAEEILVMEKAQEYLLLAMLNEFERNNETAYTKKIVDSIKKKVMVLNIPDRFWFMDEELQKLTIAKYNELTITKYNEVLKK